MMIERCEREDELLDALGRGWVGEELAAHVADCDACSELQLVAGALLHEQSAAIREAAVPSSATMWWRMQMRRRHDAAAAARRSLYVGQAATLAIAIALALGFLGADLIVEVKDVIATIRFSTPLLAALTMWLLAAPIAGYVAIRQK